MLLSPQKHCLQPYSIQRATMEHYHQEQELLVLTQGQEVVPPVRLFSYRLYLYDFCH